MRLRQAVLHPHLVLKRLVSNLKANKAIKGRSALELQGDLDEDAIRKMIVGYGEDGDGSYAKGVLEGILGEGDDKDDEGEIEPCMICMDVSRAQGVHAVVL